MFRYEIIKDDYLTMMISLICPDASFINNNLDALKSMTMHL